VLLAAACAVVWQAPGIVGIDEDEFPVVEFADVGRFGSAPFARTGYAPEW